MTSSYTFNVTNYAHNNLLRDKVIHKTSIYNLDILIKN